MGDETGEGGDLDLKEKTNKKELNTKIQNIKCVINVHLLTRGYWRYH